MKPLCIPFALFTLLWVGKFTSGAADKPSRPNIIFILADDYGIPGVGCYGGAFKTPHLDALAAGGMRFENCFSAPLCGPSRALCLLGRYAFRTGVLDNNSGGAARPQREVSIARVLQQAGYATAVAGKWRQLSHLTTREDGQRWGWDEFLIWGIGGNEAQGINRYWDPVYKKNGQLLEGTKGKYGPDLLHEFVVDFIRRNRDRPFFVYYPMPLIHGPILATPDSRKGDQPAGRKNRSQLYAANIAYLDKLTGKLVAELNALSLREKTLLVFTGDNGSVGVATINGRAITGAKGSMLEGGSRVPLIASWPGTVPAGKVLKDLVDFSDFFPTFAEVAEAKLPQGVTIDGRSFAPQLRGQPGNPRDWIYVQLGRQWYVRSQGWKLTESGALFDMQEVPFVEKPVPPDTQDESARSARKSLQTVLDQLNPAAGKLAREGKKPAKAGNKPRKKMHWLHPRGRVESSPALQCWEGGQAFLFGVPEGRLNFNRPSGTKGGFLTFLDPAINRWAILNSPSGTKKAGTGRVFPGELAFSSDFFRTL